MDTILYAPVVNSEKMVLEGRVLKSSRSAKYVVIAFVLVIVIILFLDNRLSQNVWKNERVDTQTFSVDLDEVNESYGFSNEIETDFMTQDEQTSLNAYIYNETVDDILSLKMLVKDANSCLKRYVSQTTSTVPFFSLQSLIAKKKDFFSMLLTFNKIMASLKVQVGVIEPYVLYCMLDSKYKDLLKKRNVNVTQFMKLNTIMTYGIIGDVSRLQEDGNIRKFRSVGLQPYFLQAAPPEWMVKNNGGSEKYTSHVLYSYYSWTIHVVVFQKRNGYLWHAGIDSDNELNIPPVKDLLFAEYNSAFESFTFVRLDRKWPTFAHFYIPSNPHYFLFQIPSSRFLECNSTRAPDIEPADQTEDLAFFKSRTIQALHELKKFFNPLLMHFWMFSGTMLGWYRQCDLIPYTYDVDFASWASEVDDLDYIIKYFTQNENITLRQKMGLLEEALEIQVRVDRLRVDVFFMYKINNGSWASGHRMSRGYYFRYYYPHFTLCSAELLEQKVHVPCETEDIILTEYGPNWRTPVTYWNYESSIHNRGPNIYWDEETRPKTFQEF